MVNGWLLDHSWPCDYFRHMLSSSRFVVAIHALSVIARAGGRNPVCSSVVAESVNTNPVVIRRLMRDLEKGGYVARSAPGLILLRALPSRW